MPSHSLSKPKAMIHLVVLLLIIFGTASPISSGEAPNQATTMPSLALTNPSPKVIDRYSNPPDDLVEAVGGGPFISFFGLPGHLPGDSERTAVEIRSRSHAGNDIEETALDVEMKDDAGLTLLWLPARSYPAGAFVANNKKIYQTMNDCRSAISGKGPAGDRDEQDGTCTWRYRHLDSDGKSASLISGVIKRNGGKLWGQAIDVIADRDSMGSYANLPGGLMIGQEIDIGNFAKQCPVTPPDCLVTGLFLAGYSAYPGTAGILGGGQPQDHPLYHQGITLLPHFASQVAFNDDTNADVGYQSNGQHRNYTFQDNSDSPTSIAIGGRHSFAGVFDGVSTVAFFSGGSHASSSFYDDSLSASSIHIKGKHPIAAYYDDSVSTIAIALEGSYRQQIKAHGFAVDMTGNTLTESVRVRPIKVSELPRCNPAIEGTYAAVVDAISTGYNGEIKGNGKAHLPVYCNSNAWVAH